MNSEQSRDLTHGIITEFLSDKFPTYRAVYASNDIQVSSGLHAIIYIRNSRTEQNLMAIYPPKQTMNFPNQQRSCYIFIDELLERVAKVCSDDTQVFNNARSLNGLSFWMML